MPIKIDKNRSRVTILKIGFKQKLHIYTYHSLRAQVSHLPV